MNENFNPHHNALIFSCKIVFFIFLLLPFVGLSQKHRVKKGTIGYLGYNNGFNGIVLGDSITRIPGTKLKYMDGNSRIDDEGCLKYEYTDASWQKLEDSLSIRGIGLRTWGDRIVNIYIFFKKTDGSALLGSFISDYGTFTSRPDDYKDIYGWDSKDVRLDLLYDADLDTGVAIFTCKPLYKLIAISKLKAEAPKTPASNAVHQ